MVSTCLESEKKIKNNYRFYGDILEGKYFEETKLKFVERYVDVYKIRFKKFASLSGVDKGKLNRLLFFVTKSIEEFAEYVGEVLYGEEGLEYIFLDAENEYDLIENENYEDFLNMYKKSIDGMESFSRICKLFGYDLTFGNENLLKKCSETKIVSIFNKRQLLNYSTDMVNCMSAGYEHEDMLTCFGEGSYLDDSDVCFNFMYNSVIADNNKIFKILNKKTIENEFNDLFIEEYNTKKFSEVLTDKEILDFKNKLLV